MKLMKLFAVLTLVGISNAALGYAYTLFNETNKPMTVKVVTVGGAEKTKVIPGGSGDLFTFEDNKQCLRYVFVNGEQVAIQSSKARCQNIDDFYISGTTGSYVIRTTR